MAAEKETVERVYVPIVRWVSMADALWHIETAADCDRATAMARMRAAIADGRLGARWSDEEDERDTPPVGGFWNTASIRLDHGGEVLHQFLEKRLIKVGASHSLVQSEGPPRYRGIVISRDDLHALWPITKLPEAPAKPETSFLRPSKHAIRDYTRQLYVDRVSDPPNMDEAERLIRRELPRAQRKTIRAVLKEEEFAKQRRRSGVRRKRKACR